MAQATAEAALITFVPLWLLTGGPHDFGTEQSLFMFGGTTFTLVVLLANSKVCVLRGGLGDGAAPRDRRDRLALLHCFTEKVVCVCLCGRAGDVDKGVCTASGVSKGIIAVAWRHVYEYHKIDRYARKPSALVACKHCPPGCLVFVCEC